jgi:2-hydroxy-3-keto-5-methylthiopentenyl-1-phosphate phosphatase
MVLEAFGDQGVFDRVEGDLVAGRTSFREVIELEFATVRAPLAEVNAFLAEEVRLREGFAELASRHSPLILSSGFHELIEPLLERVGAPLDVRANRIEPLPTGWRVSWRAGACPVCGDYCKRSGLPAGEVVFVGDGYSDRCAALAAGRVFARDSLAAYLLEQGVPFEPFDTLADVAAALS